MSQALADRMCALLGSHHLIALYVRPKGCVGIPEHLQNQPQVRFDLGLNVPVLIDPLEVTAAGITAGLSILRRRCVITMPWSAVIGAAVGDGTVNVLYGLPPPAPAPTPPPPPKPVQIGNVVHVDFAARRRAGGGA